MKSKTHRKDLESKMIAEGRIPPGQSLTLKFPVLDLGRQPRLDPATWELQIFGAVEEEQTLSFQEFSDLPISTVTMDLHCVTRWSRFDTSWRGVSIATLLDRGILLPKPGANFVQQHGADGYTTNLPLSVARQENYLLATHVDGEPLTVEHGFPVRATIGFIPGRSDLFTPYLWKGAKWIVGLELMTEDQPGFWEKNGYSNEAEVWSEQRFEQLSPRNTPRESLADVRPSGSPPSPRSL